MRGSPRLCRTGERPLRGSSFFVGQPCRGTAKRRPRGDCLPSVYVPWDPRGRIDGLVRLRSLDFTGSASVLQAASDYYFAFATLLCCAASRLPAASSTVAASLTTHSVVSQEHASPIEQKRTVAAGGCSEPSILQRVSFRASERAIADVAPCWPSCARRGGWPRPPRGVVDKDG